MKKLIIYLSKKSLSLGNGSGMTRKWFGNDSGMTRFSLASLICLCMLTVGVGNAWGTNWSYTFDATPTWSPNSGTTRSMTVNSATWSVSTSNASGSPTIWGAKNNSNGSGGIQFGNSGSKYYGTTTLSTNYFSSYSVSAVTVNLLINGSKTTTITVTQGATTIGSPSYGTGSEWHDFTANTTAGTSGTLTLTITTTQAIYIHSISVTYTEPSCTKVAAPSVTATPSSTKIDLSWAAVTNASSYSVTCKIKSTGVAAGTVGGVSGSGPYSCSITGLTDGVEYTWSVMSVGDGSTYCASGNTPATGDAIPGTYYTVTWNAAGSSPQTTSVRSGTKPTFPSTPSSCDATSTTFYGWATSTWSGPLDDVSAKTIYTSASDMPTVSGSGVNYYAVFAKKSASGDYVKGTKSDLTDGQTVMIVNYYYGYAMSSDDDATYDFYRDAIPVDISDNTISSPDGALIWTVEEGENGGYYFKHGDNYINVGYSSKNDNYYLYFDTDKDEWTPITSGYHYVLQSGNNDAYYLYIDNSDYLFDVYTGSGDLYNVDFYFPKVAYSKYLTTCCDKAITVSSPTITGEGTIEFTPSTSPIATCDDDVEIVARVTPAAGYACTALNFSGGSVSVSPDVSSNKPSAPSYQDFTLSFAQNTNATLTTSATFTAKALTGWTWGYRKDADAKNNTGDILAIPDIIEAYIGQYVRFDISGYTPNDVLAAKKGYTYTAGGVAPEYDNTKLSYVGADGSHLTYYTTKGLKAGDATLTFTSVGNGELTKTVTIRVKAMPVVKFKDLVHGESFDDVAGTVGTGSDAGLIFITKSTPTHSDLDEPGSGNSCEKQHLHLVGWIRSDWPALVAYLNGTGSAPATSAITTAGVDGNSKNYYLAAGASLNTETYNGFTFYAVWAKIE